MPRAPCLLSMLYLLLAACASAPAPAVLQLPEALKPGAGETLLTTLSANGVQIYECRAQPNAGAAWVFVAPEAQLFDVKGLRSGTHYAGPHWEANDGSRIVGKLKASVVAPEAGAIPWLLLSAQSDGPEGSFSKVTSVQRIHTAGGVAPPASECSDASLGNVERVAYTADYRFFVAKR